MNGQLQLQFDYEQLDSETRIMVMQRTGEIKTLMRRTAQDIIEIGEKLIEVKVLLGHGHFGTWLESEFGWKERTARNFMAVSERFKSANFADLNIAPSALYLLAAPSTPDEARLEAIERAEAGEVITFTEAKGIVAEYKPEIRPDEIVGEMIKRLYRDNPNRITLPDVLEYIQNIPEAAPAIEKAIAKAKQEIARQREPEPAISPPLPQGKYRCIVIDPPWPVRKIEREERPNQGVNLDYQTMTLEEIEALPIRDLADESGCHLYLWVTQKYLPAGLKLVEAWGFRYECLLTWRKNVGFTPYSWMYDTEHVIFARCGNLPLQQLGLRLSFEAAVNGHSVKPDIFFNERVLLASPGPHLEMFARKEREGFEVWGNEV